jgi:hypothetical protein
MAGLASIKEILQFEDYFPVTSTQVLAQLPLSSAAKAVVQLG